MPSAGLDHIIPGNISLIRKSYKNNIAMGPAVNASAFRMIIHEYPKLEFLVQTTQIPELKREIIEAKGPLGVSFVSYGKPLNSGHITISFKEVISGACYKAIRDAVVNGKELSITLSLIPEENTLSVGSGPIDLALSVPANNVDLTGCLIELDTVDLSVDEGSTMVKPNGTIHYSWLSWYDDDATKSIGLDLQLDPNKYLNLVQNRF